jgi:hypothetical protein
MIALPTMTGTMWLGALMYGIPDSFNKTFKCLKKVTVSVDVDASTSTSEVKNTEGNWSRE